MALRKAASYSKFKARPFTRHSRKRSKSYIKSVPFSKIVRYFFGDLKGYREGKHKFFVKLIADRDIQIRDNALEAARMLIHKQLEENSPGEYFLAIKVYPHHFLRNNKTAGTAGADRLSSGMSHSFGVIEGRAAMVKEGKEIAVVSCLTESAAKVARTAMASVKAKMPCRTKILYERK